MSFKSGGRKCKFESLESRRVLAGNVVANVHHGDLVIKGDNFGNGITITAGPTPNTVTVTGVTLAGSPTSINGISNGSVTFNNFTKGIKAKMSYGNDSVDVNNITVNGKSLISGGAGLDNISLTACTFNNSLEVRLGDGADTFTETNTTVLGKMKITGGTDHDEVTLTGNTLGRLNVCMGKGDDSLTIEDTQVTTQSKINGGKGINPFVDLGSNFYGSVLDKSNFNGGRA